MMEGSGQQKYEDGQYDGVFKDGVRWGQGIMEFNNVKIYFILQGDVYTGLWEDDNQKGFAYMYYAFGDVYEGEFSNNLKHGKGKYIYRSLGETYDGEWVEDKRKG